MFRKVSIILLAVFFIAAGAYHFISPETYRPLMPDYLPWHLGLIYLSGAAEVLGGIGISFPKWRHRAGWGLIALLVAVFPANIHMLVNHLPLGGKSVPDWAYWMRLPLQGVLIAWVYWACAKPSLSASQELRCRPFLIKRERLYHLKSREQAGCSLPPAPSPPGRSKGSARWTSNRR